MPCRPTPAPSSQHALPLARRTFAAAGRLYCELEVYDPTPDETTGLPRVSAGFAVVRPGGAVERQGALVPIEPTADRRLAQMLTVPLRGLKPGDYDLVLRLEDKVAGRTQELREPFSLTRPALPTPAFYRDLLQDYVEGRGEDAVATLRHLAHRRRRGPGQADRRLRRGPGPRRGHAPHRGRLGPARESREPATPRRISRSRAGSSRERDATPTSGGTGSWPWASRCRPGAIARPRPSGSSWSARSRFRSRPRPGWRRAPSTSGAPSPTVWAGSASLARRATWWRRRRGSTAQALVIDPSLAEARLRLGRTLQRSGEPDEAERGAQARRRPGRWRPHGGSRAPLPGRAPRAARRDGGGGSRVPQGPRAGPHAPAGGPRGGRDLVARRRSHGRGRGPRDGTARAGAPSACRPGSPTTWASACVPPRRSTRFAERRAREGRWLSPCCSSSR